MCSDGDTGSPSGSSDGFSGPDVSEDPGFRKYGRKKSHRGYDSSIQDWSSRYNHKLKPLGLTGTGMPPWSGLPDGGWNSLCPQCTKRSPGRSAGVQECRSAGMYEGVQEVGFRSITGKSSPAFPDSRCAKTEALPDRRSAGRGTFRSDVSSGIIVIMRAFSGGQPVLRFTARREYGMIWQRPIGAAVPGRFRFLPVSCFSLERLYQKEPLSRLDPAQQCSMTDLCAACDLAFVSCFGCPGPMPPAFLRDCF